MIPTSATSTPSPQPKSKSNTGAIAGGVVGGIIFLCALISIIILCLRHRRRTAPTPPRAELATTPALSPGGKPTAHNSPYTTSTHSPMVEAPSYSSHADHYNTPTPTSTSAYYHPASPHHSPYNATQPYYPPPPPAGAAHPHAKFQHVSHELPSSATPAPLEMPQLHSPVPKRGGY